MSATKTNNQYTDKELVKLSLNELMARLDEIVAWFNNGDIDIEQATAKFDEGVRLADAIKAKLATTENQINQIKLKLTKIVSE
ncbi:MAG: exodeoxyribonuclease VII small subunit [Candidatus Saccharibacteria bacterium]|nr:exodeoxyribonuclease VII small subunit [Candidatus Saccharibacteria bacterium]